MLSTIALVVALSATAPDQGTDGADLRMAFTSAAREANRNPYDFEAQVRAAQLGFAVTLVPGLDKQGSVALSLMRFGKRAVELRPQAAEGYLWEGIGIAQSASVYGRLGEETVANGYLAAMERSIRLDPECLGGLAKAHLAYMHANAPAGSKIANRQQANTFANKVLRQAPSSAAALYYAAQISMLSGDLARANRALEALRALRRGSTFDMWVAGAVRPIAAGPEDAQPSTKLSGGSQ